MAISSCDLRIRGTEIKGEGAALAGPAGAGHVDHRCAGSGGGRCAGRKPCGPACQHHQRLFAKLAGTARSAPTAISVPPTATSALALLAPAALPAPASTFIVTTAADVVESRRRATQPARGGGPGATRTAALDAIGFASSLEGQTLVLTGGELTGQLRI